MRRAQRLVSIASILCGVGSTSCGDFQCNDIGVLGGLAVDVTTSQGAGLMAFTATVSSDTFTRSITCPNDGAIADPFQLSCRENGGFILWGLSEDFSPPTLEVELNSLAGGFNGSVSPIYLGEADWSDSCQTLVTGDAEVVVQP